LIAFMASGRTGAGSPEPPPRKAGAERIKEKAADPKPAPEAPKVDPYPQDLAEIDGYVRAAAAADEFARALGILKMARGRYPLREWMAAIDRRTARLREEFGAAYQGLEARALEARRRGAESEVRAALGLAAKWGIEEYPPRLDKALSALPVVEQPWRPLFDGSSPAFIHETKGWRVEGGALVREVGAPVPAESRETFEEGDVRIRFRARPPGHVFFAVRQGLNGNCGVQLEEAALKALGEAEHALIFTMVGETVTATLDGKPLAVTTTGRPRSGAVQFNAQGAELRVRSVEYRPR
jgi:hypothetical protein